MILKDHGNALKIEVLSLKFAFVFKSYNKHCPVRRFAISNRYQHKWYTKMNQITAFPLCRDLKQSIPEHNKQDIKIKARKFPVRHNLVC